MKMGFISDTHGGYDDLVKALHMLEECDQICHIGDVLYHGPRNEIPETYHPKKIIEVLKEREDIVYVRGNCDADVDEMVLNQDLSSKSRVVSFDDFKFFLVHGYEETEDERLEEAKRLGCDAVVSGHTHVKVLEEKDGIVVLNPGSTTIPKDGTRSVALYEDGQIKLLNLESQAVIACIKL